MTGPGRRESPEGRAGDGAEGTDAGPPVGAVEAGGTKFVCAVGTGPDDVRDVTRFPTTGPEETLGRTLDFLGRHARDGALAAVGIGSFGPVDVDPGSPTWGHVSSTPKEGWSDTEFAPRIRRELGVPVGFDTDVNAAALGEGRWGAARGLDTFAYVTVGTGIGGGGMVEGRLLHGLLHPEMGHMRIPREADDDFPGICPFHGDCLEGLATGPALEARWGRPATQLPDDHPAWDLEARHLAHVLVNLTLVLSPERIVVGGGVMKRRSLYPAVRLEMADLLAGYLRAPEVLEGMDRYVVPPGLGDRAGVLGALALGQRAARGG